MTNIKAKGFDSPAQLREYLDDIEEPIASGSSADPDAALERQVADLRAQIEDLKEQLQAARDRRAEPERRSIVRVAAALASTFVLGRAAQYMRLGILGAVAVPMIAARLDRRLWSRM